MRLDATSVHARSSRRTAASSAAAELRHRVKSLQASRYQSRQHLAGWETNARNCSQAEWDSRGDAGEGVPDRGWSLDTYPHSRQSTKELHALSEPKEPHPDAYGAADLSRLCRAGGVRRLLERLIPRHFDVCGSRNNGNWNDGDGDGDDDTVAGHEGTGHDGAKQVLHTRHRQP
jgi:hypothetical protein